eukprot:9776757-Ditylum_brightwellii.AAC.1
MMTNKPRNKILVFSCNDSSGRLDFVNAVSSNGSSLQLSGGTSLPVPTDDLLASQDSLVVADNYISLVETADSGGEIH